MIVLRHRKTGCELLRLDADTLRGADLRDCILVGADLRNADLAGADLRGANLHDADLRGANLESTELLGADLTGALYDERTSGLAFWALARYVDALNALVNAFPPCEVTPAKTPEGRGDEPTS